MKNNSLIAKWISECEEERKKECKNNLCDICKFNDVCIDIIKYDTRFRLREYYKK